MISETVLILTIVAAVFITGVSFGQILLRIRLARLERVNLELEQKRLIELKLAIQFRPQIGESSSSPISREVRNEIENLLGDIENP